MIESSMMRSLGLFLLVTFFVSACATVPVAQRERRIESVIRLVNDGDVERLVELSSVPFVLDQEIIALEGDVASLWRGLVDAGLAFDDADIRRIDPVDATSHREFGDTFEMDVYFQQYLAEDGTIVEIDSDLGGFLLLLGDKQKGYPMIFGLKGPM
jgi:hypothetical protein